MSKPLSITEFMSIFPDDDACLEYLFKKNFGDEFACPRCGEAGKFRKLSKMPAYTCQCGEHIHPMAGTPFHRSHTPLQKWFYAIYLFTTTRHGVSAKELQRQLSVNYKTAWRMGHEIRKYMGYVDGQGPLDGDVEADEAYVGGARPGKRGRGAGGKIVVFAMQDRDGEMIAKVVPNAKGKTLKTEIEAHVAKGSTIHTDEWCGYRGLERKGYSHSTVDHGNKEYARNGSHVNTVEAFFGIFKRSIRSTHIWISKRHSPKYLAEFEYRQNRRHAPASMFPHLLGCL
jgi:transposase